MGTVVVREADNRKMLDDFVRLPFRLYEGDEAWVPPLISEFKKYVLGKDNFLNQSGPNIRIVAYRDGVVCGRLLVGIDNHLNEAKGFRQGYLALYEAVEDSEVSRALLDYAKAWLVERGMAYVKGPLSVPGGDDYRGFLIDNFKDPTYVMNTYNKPYYNQQFIDYGFEKYLDCYGYDGDFERRNIEKFERLVPLAMKRYGYRVDRIDLDHMDREMKDVKRVIDMAMPTDWDDFIPPNEEEIALVAKQLLPYADPDFIYIARTLEGEPIGFDIALPDYNQVLKKMKGRLLPFGLLKFFFLRKKIDRLRIFVLFVVPEFRRKGVSGAIYLNIFRAGVRKGYRRGEGSTIWEYNKPMMADVHEFTGEPYKTYRVYRMGLVASQPARQDV